MKGSFAACSIVGNVASPLSADMAREEEHLAYEGEVPLSADMARGEEEHLAYEGEVMPAPTQRTALGVQVKADAPLARNTPMEDTAKRLRRMVCYVLAWNGRNSGGRREPM